MNETKKIIWIFIFLFLTKINFVFSVTYKVIRVIDGDTIVIATGEKIRYIGMDTPEMHDPRPQVKYFAKKAKEINANLVLNKNVNLEFDVEKYDRYNRILAYVYINKIMVNAYLLKEGYAQVYTFPPNVKYEKYFLKLQKEARENNKGLWGNFKEGIKRTKKNKSKNSSMNTSFLENLAILLQNFLRKIWWH